MTTSPLGVAAALAKAIESIDGSPTFRETLDAVVAATRMSLPDFPHVSLSLRRPDGTVETASGTDELARELDELQHELAEGPCVEAMGEESLVVVEDLHREQRWPRYVPVARSRGICSQLGVPLFASGTHIGGLNLYARERADIDEACTETARLFATHSAIVLRRAQHEEQLRTALETRKLIGQATGITMERYQVDPEQAFRFLVRTSSASNTKLRDLAKELVSSAIERYRRDDVRQQDGGPPEVATD